MVENQINFASTFKIFQEGKIGGQGSLFLCKVRERRGPVGDHLNEGDLCAVKAIKSNLGESNQGTTTGKELREIKNLVKLGEHKNIVRLFYSWEESDALSKTIYFAMELCDLCSLDELLIDPNYPLNQREALIFSLHIAEGLKYIHYKNPPILHCDLKPSNVVLASTPVGGVNAKLVDFGLSTELKSASCMSSLKPQQIYSPPEILSAAKNYTTKVDMYGFGIIFCQIYVCASAKMEKKRLMDEFKVFTSSLSIPNYEEYFQNSLKNVQIPAEASKVKQLICQTTSRSPDDRPSASAICEELRNMLSNDETHYFVSNVPYMKNPHTEIQIGRRGYLREFCQLNSARLEVLTSLTLSHVKVSIKSLLSTLMETTQLESLRLILEFTDHSHTKEFPSKELREKRLCRLKSFYFQELIQNYPDKSLEYYLRYIQTSPLRLSSMLFFGPFNQIRENKMRVVLFFENYKLIDIQMEDSKRKFELRGWCTLFSLRTLLYYETFKRISLRDMIAVFNPKVSPLAAISNPPIEKELNDFELFHDGQSDSTCTSLQLVSVSLTNLNNGRMFQNFQNLQELYFQGRLDVKPPSFIEISFLPRTIRKLVLSEVTIGTDTSIDNYQIWKLEYLWLQACEFAPNFMDRFHKLFEVEHLKVSQEIVHHAKTFKNPKLLFPSVDFVHDLTKSANWKSLSCDHFIWNAAESVHEQEQAIMDMRVQLQKSAKAHNVPEGHQAIYISRNSSNPSELMVKKLTKDEDYRHGTSWQFYQNTYNVSGEKAEENLEDKIDLKNELKNAEAKTQSITLHSGLNTNEKLDETAPENFYFETPSQKDDFDTFDSLIDKPSSKFKKKPKNIKHIQLRRCKVNGSALNICLMPCMNKLETLKLEMVQIGQQLSRVCCPKLKTFVFHMDSEGGGDYANLSNYFEDLSKLRNILFFRLSDTLNGLWKSGVNVRIQKMKCCYLLLDHSKYKVLMECMPRANEVFNEIMKENGNEEVTATNDVQMLTLHQCNFNIESLTPLLQLSYLNLRHVKGITFKDLFSPASGALISIKTLHTMLYEQKGAREEVFLKDFKETLTNLNVLSLCGVNIKSLTSLQNCKRLMLRGNQYYFGFEEEYPKYFRDMSEIFIVGDGYYQPSFMTLCSFLDFVEKSESDVKSITFVRFLDDDNPSKMEMSTKVRIDLAYNKDPEGQKKQIDFCKTFVSKFDVNGKDFTLYWDEVNNQWKATECTEQVENLMLQDELFEYRL